MTASIYALPRPTSATTFLALIEDCIAHNRLDDARGWDDERRTQEIRAMRLDAQQRDRLATIRGVGAVLAMAKERR